MHIKNKRGQNTVEYVLLVTAVLAVIIFMVTKSNSPLQTQLGNTLNDTFRDVGTLKDRLVNSHQENNT